MTAHESKPMDLERLALLRLRYGELGWLIPNGEARDYVMELLADRDLHEGLLGGLLAVIHGGQHTAAVGLAQSVADAKDRWHALHEEIERAGGLLVNEQQSARHYATELAAALAKLAMSDADRDRHAKRADESEQRVRMFARAADNEKAGRVAAERDARAEHATRERTDAQFCRTLDALSARSQGGDETLPSEARAIIDEVARLRARVRVEAEDVERAGVTWRHVEAWLVAQGWTAKWQAHGKCYRTPDLAKGVIIGEPDIASSIRHIAQRPGLDILDEMAAMEVPDGK